MGSWSFKRLVRWVLLLVVIVAAVMTGYNVVRWHYYHESSHIFGIFIWAFVALVAFAVIAFIHFAETYPQRERAAKFDKELKRRVEQLQIHDQEK